jgi:acetoin utilization protein AcuB
MLVGERMTRHPLTVADDTSIDDALHMMRERKVRRLPVVDTAGQMVGIVSDKDLLHASPSPATSLSVYELHYLLSKLNVRSVMSSPVITVAPDTPLEEAARIMADNKIGGLPVLEDGRLVGIITETDVFKVLLELLGARLPGLRVTVRVHEGKGVLARLAQTIAELGGNIISVVTFLGEGEADRLITMKIGDCDGETVRSALDHAGLQVVDFREA